MYNKQVKTKLANASSALESKFKFVEPCNRMSTCSDEPVLTKSELNVVCCVGSVEIQIEI